MADPHLEAIRAGVRYDKQLRALFGRRIGSRDHPRGVILAAYRRARAGLLDAYGNPIAVEAILGEYRAAVETTVRTGLDDAAVIGADQAEDVLRAWGIDIARPSTSGIKRPAVTAVMRTTDAQLESIKSGNLTAAQVLGGSARVGLFAPGIIQREAADQMANVAAIVQEGIMYASAETAGAFGDFVRQAVAVVDERTTPCCLGVHGQIRNMGEPFRTPDPPAYSDWQDRPPFHHFCRTSQVLLPRLAGRDVLTDRMRRAATLERTLREQPDYEAPHPANAFTRTEGE